MTTTTKPRPKLAPTTPKGKSAGARSDAAGHAGREAIPCQGSTKSKAYGSSSFAGTASLRGQAVRGSGSPRGVPTSDAGPSTFTEG